MEITRDVILDLLPLYLADEVSADTRALIEKYLETDPKLAAVAERSKAMELQGEIPIPLSKGDEMKTYQKAKLRLFLFIVIASGMIATILIALLVFFMYSS